jgi:hypothetical protein
MDLPRLHGRRPAQKFHLLNRRGLIIVLLRRRRSQPTTMQMDGWVDEATHLFATCPPSKADASDSGELICGNASVRLTYACRKF